MCIRDRLRGCPQPWRHRQTVVLIQHPTSIGVFRGLAKSAKGCLDTPPDVHRRISGGTGRGLTFGSTDHVSTFLKRLTIL
eukprot:6199258-Prorocentrum_lima.AAC.1